MAVIFVKSDTSRDNGGFVVVESKMMQVTRWWLNCWFAVSITSSMAKLSSPATNATVAAMMEKVVTQAMIVRGFLVCSLLLLPYMLHRHQRLNIYFSRNSVRTSVLQSERTCFPSQKHSVLCVLCQNTGLDFQEQTGAYFVVSTCNSSGSSWSPWYNYLITVGERQSITDKLERDIC